MDHDYSKRGCLLPEGCKDLIDVISPKPLQSDFVATVQVPEVNSTGLEVIVEGRYLRIIGKPLGGQERFESRIEVPPGFEIAAARAVYVKGWLRIVIPRR